MPFVPPIIGVVAGLLSFAFINEQTPLYILNSIGLTFLVTIMMYVLQLQASVSDIKKSTDKFISYEMLQNIIKIIDEAYACHRGLGDICRKKFSRSQISFQDILYKATNKEYKIDKDELQTVAMLLVEHATIKICATSFVNESDWWNKSWGENYLKAHKEARSRNVNIERVFIFPNQQSFEKSKKILNDNLSNGVTVKYTFVNKLEKKFSKDVIIIDNKFSGSLRLNKRAIQEITLSNHHDVIAQANEIFNIASSGAEIFDGCEK